MISMSSNEKLQSNKDDMMKRMQHFCETRQCRRHMILSHFDESLPKDPEDPPKPNCCDNCDKLIKRGTSESLFEKVDLTQETKLLLEVIDHFDGRFGLVVPIKFLRGFQDAKIPKAKMSSKLYGAGKEHSEIAWKTLAKLCIRENMLQEKNANSFRGPGNFHRNSFGITTVAISQKGRDFVHHDYKNGIPFELSEQAEMLFRKRKPTSTSGPQNRTGSWQDKNDRSEKKQEATAFLYKELRMVRDKIAEDLQCPQQTIADNGACFLMALYPPNDLGALAKVKGFSEIKAEKFGQIFLDKIQEFLGKGARAEQSDADSKDEDQEEFLKMKHLHENAVDYSKEKCMEYALTDEVVKDFGNEFLMLSNGSQTSCQEFPSCSETKPTSTDNMWGDDSDDVFDDLPLDQIVTDHEEKCSPSSSNLASKLITLNDSCVETKPERNLTSSLISMNEDWKESKQEKNLTSSLFTIDSSWKEAKKKEVTDSLLSIDNDWTGVQRDKNVTSSLVSLYNQCDEKMKNLSTLMSASHDGGQSAVSFARTCPVKVPQKTTSAPKSHIMYEDDSDEEEKKPESNDSNKRSVPEWLTKPEAIKKRMKKNSIFKM